jgi:hypothetical protein
MSDDQLDLLCEHCGQTFSKFMHDLAAKNAEVVCPNCGENSAGKPAKPATTPVAGTPAKKTT